MECPKVSLIEKTGMRTVKSVVLVDRKRALAFFLAVFLPSVSLARWIDESGPGNGTDYVKVLFAEAALNDVRLFQRTSLQTLKDSTLPPDIKNWLLNRGRESTRFEKLQTVLQNIELRFQSDFCSDETRKPATICALVNTMGSTQYPVVISLENNRLTTPQQAMAMLIHEAGHFIGESDHLYLDRVGVELVQQMKPRPLIIQDADSTVFAVNPFLSQEECNQGISSQALSLRAEVQRQIVERCLTQGINGIDCQPSRIQWIFTGEPEFIVGRGFTSRLKCHARGVLSW